MQKKVSVIALSLAAALALAGCANDGTRYRADTYYAGQVNQVQEVNTVQIIAVNAARVAVPNDDNRDTARMTGAILGAHCRRSHRQPQQSFDLFARDGRSRWRRGRRFGRRCSRRIVVHELYRRRADRLPYGFRQGASERTGRPSPANSRPARPLWCRPRPTKRAFSPTTLTAAAADTDA